MKWTYLSLLLLLTCCQRNNIVKVTDSKDRVDVEINNYPFDDQKIFDSNKYLDSIRYVFLEETKESIVPNIDFLFFVDDMIIVVSSKVASIFFFDADGKYLRKINKRGRGPGEYLKQENVMVDEKLKRVMVYDNDANKMLYYDFNGNHLKTLNHFCDDALIRDIINMPNGSFLCYNQEFRGDNRKSPAGVWKVDSCGKFDKYIYPETEYYPVKFAVGLSNFTTLNGDTIGFFDSNKANTYYIVHDSLFCRSHYKMPEKTRADYAGVRQTDDEYTIVFSYQEKGNYIFMTWGAPDKRIFMTALSKSDHTIEAGLFFSSVMENYTVLGGREVSNNSSDRLTSWMDYDVLATVGEKHSDDHSRTRIKKILDAAPKTTNPVIQISYVKK